MIAEYRELMKYRELLYMIAWRDIRIKYKQSIMGFMWAILMPIIIISAGILVKYAFSLLSKETFTFTKVATISVKAIPWAFFISSIRFSTNSLIGNNNLVTKIYFPREIFPIASVISQLFDFMIASMLLIVILAVSGVGSSIYLFFVPLFLVILILLVTSMGIFLSAASLFFRDVKYIMEVIITFAIFFTPVFYEVSMFGKWGTLLLLNPVAPILEGLNDCVVYHQMPQIPWLLYSMTISIVGSIISFKFFKKLEPAFAECI